MPFGLLLITGGMFALTQVGTDTPYWGFLVPVLFVMGLGMGGTMMPLMTSALKTLQSHQVARGSTLLNITQQIASSVGVAVISVVFTNYLSASALAGPAIAALHDPNLVDDVGGPAAVPAGPDRGRRRLRQHLPRRRDPRRAHADPGARSCRASTRSHISSTTRPRRRRSSSTEVRRVPVAGTAASRPGRVGAAAADAAALSERAGSSR